MMNDQASPNVSAVIERYMELRQKRKELKTKFIEDDAPLKKRMDDIETAMLQYMNRNGLENLPTKTGTAYKSSKTKATVVDWDATLMFIREREAWHLLIHNVSDIAVREYAEEGTVVPGTSLKTFINVNVRSK